ncbi:MAG: hypothetical protein JO027_15215 [Solirubrobacterales bacterium]|nr:hypothetical protein [Solirubrobacterales bacterium]
MQHLELAGLRRSVLVALVIAALIPVAVAAWALTQLGGSASKKSPAASASTAMKSATMHHAQAVSYRNTPLFQAVAGVNTADTPAKGYLPPSTCKGMSATLVLCTRPHYAVYGVAFRTYPSLKALYAAYEARVSALSQQPFRSNYGNCTETDISGEVSWNHNFLHPSMYPLSMFTSGQIKDDQAAGRVFCTFTNDLLDIVWTQDDGRLMAEVTGAPHLDTYLWWKWVHHSVVLPGSANPMATMPGMAQTTSTSSQSMTSTHSSMTMPGSNAKKSSKGSSSMGK